MLSIKERIELMRASIKGELSKDKCNLIRHDTADVTNILKSGIGSKKYRIATSGYSFDQEGYKEVTTAFLKELDKQLGRRHTGYVTTPAVADGSIYDITTQVSGLGADNVAYFTTERYWESTDFNGFNKDINARQYMKTPIYVFPDNETYTEATANASNILVCTGGRKVAVTEIIEALKRKSKVMLIINPNLNNEAYNHTKGRVDNAAEYFLDYMIHCQKDLPETEQLDLDFLKKHPGRITHLLRVYNVRDAEEAKDAAFRASNFLTNQTPYDFWPDKADLIDRTAGIIDRETDRKMTMQHYMKTGEMKRLYD